MKRKTGQYVTISNVGEKCQAFLPESLPLKPELALYGNLRELLDQTLRGRDRISDFVRDRSGELFERSMMLALEMLSFASYSGDDLALYFVLQETFAKFGFVKESERTPTEIHAEIEKTDCAREGQED